MTAASHQNWPLEVLYRDFINDVLPLYFEPYVRIRIEPASREYKLPKALLCEQSTFFAAAFNGSFREGEEQFMALMKEEDVVSTRSFELLVQWMFVGRVNFDELPPEEAITATIEFVRLADMCKVTGMESLMAERIKALIVDKPPLTKTKKKKLDTNNKPDTNTRCLTSKHIISAVLLPKGHPVRSILVSAAVPGYFACDDYLNRALEVPDVAVDLLQEVRAAIKSFQSDGYETTFRDPLSDARIALPRYCGIL
ncbi:hypothetical protein BDZ45DRAFT_664419 [Acephala macrosclerotiorum]|nr:hypothetical protein BDZ45DRAFT_664419 [Acephala macrosclerotiorum]